MAAASASASTDKNAFDYDTLEPGDIIFERTFGQGHRAGLTFFHTYIFTGSGVTDVVHAGLDDDAGVGHVVRGSLAHKLQKIHRTGRENVEYHVFRSKVHDGGEIVKQALRWEREFVMFDEERLDKKIDLATRKSITQEARVWNLLQYAKFAARRNTALCAHRPIDEEANERGVLEEIQKGVTCAHFVLAVLGAVSLAPLVGEADEWCSLKYGTLPIGDTEFATAYRDAISRENFSALASGLYLGVHELLSSGQLNFRLAEWLLTPPVAKCDPKMINAGSVYAHFLAEAKRSEDVRTWDYRGIINPESYNPDNIDRDSYRGLTEEDDNKRMAAREAFLLAHTIKLEPEQREILIKKIDAHLDILEPIEDGAGTTAYSEIFGYLKTYLDEFHLQPTSVMLARAKALVTHHADKYSETVKDASVALIDEIDVCLASVPSGAIPSGDGAAAAAGGSTPTCE